MGVVVAVTLLMTVDEPDVLTLPGIAGLLIPVNELVVLMLVREVALLALMDEPIVVTVLGIVAVLMLLSIPVVVVLVDTMELLVRTDELVDMMEAHAPVDELTVMVPVDRVELLKVVVFGRSLAPRMPGALTAAPSVRF